MYIERLFGERVVPGQVLDANARELIAVELRMRADYARMLSERDTDLFGQLLARAIEALEAADEEPLSPALFELLDIAIKRWDILLNLFYDRETALAADISRLQREFAQASAHALSTRNEIDMHSPPILGDATAVGPSSGIYSDGWMEMGGQFVIRCHGPTRELRFRGRPPQGEGDAELTIEVATPGDTVPAMCETRRFGGRAEPVDLRVSVRRSTPCDFRIRFGSTRVYNPAVRSQACDNRDLILWLESVEVSA